MIKSASKVFLLMSMVCILVCCSLMAQGQTRGASGSRGSAYIAGKSGVLFDFGLHYGQSEANGNPSTQNFKNNISVYDIKFGYVTDSNWYFGALYSAKNYSTTTETENGKTGGLGFGCFFSNNFNIRAFYRHNEIFGEYRNGTGFQADLEYKVNFVTNFYIGALVSHRQVKFTTNESISNFEDYTLKETYPAISLGFLIN